MGGVEYFPDTAALTLNDRVTFTGSHVLRNAVKMLIHRCLRVIVTFQLLQRHATQPARTDNKHVGGRNPDLNLLAHSQCIRTEVTIPGAPNVRRQLNGRGDR